MPGEEAATRSKGETVRLLLTLSVKLLITVAMTGIEQLLTVARAYGTAEGIELSTVSWRVMGDTKKLPALEEGKDIQVKRLEGAMSWFSRNWPANAAWPTGVDRPENDKESEAEAQVSA